MNKDKALKIAKLCEGILAMAGVFGTPRPGSRPAGVSKIGANVFVSEALANNGDIQTGATLIHALAAFVTPFNILGKKELKAMETLTANVLNPNLYTVLDTLHQDRKGPPFAVTVAKAVDVPTKSDAIMSVAVKLFDHWGVMSPAQKALSIAATGIQTHKTDKGGAVCDLVIVSGEGTAFTVKDALDMLQQGKNPYPLVANWDQIYRLTRVYNDRPTNEALMDFASSHGLLGIGMTDAAVPQITKQAIEQSGSRPAPQYGVGAIASPKGTKVPPGYREAARMPQGNIVVPQANGATAAGALAGSLVGTKAGANGISADAVSTYGKWDKKDAYAQDKGSEGGSTLVAGLGNLKKSDPYLFSALLAFIARYGDNVTDKNPAQYIASLVGISLARIVAGKAEADADRDGIRIAQTIHAKNPADFAKLQISLRAMYANFGVSSRADAYQLSNQAYSEGRINESDLVAMQQMYDLVYDENAFGSITKLLQGAEKGLFISRLPLMFMNSMTDGLPNAEEAAEDFRARNREKFKMLAAEEPVEEAAEGEQVEEGEEGEEEMAEAPEGEAPPEAPAPEAPPEQEMANGPV